MQFCWVCWRKVGKCLSLYSQDFLLRGWPTPLRSRVFDAIKIAMSLVVCFLQRWFHHWWQNRGTIFLTKILLESPRSSASVLSLNTPAVPHQIQAIIFKIRSSRSRLSLFQHGHPNGWSWSTMTGKSVWRWTISNPHLLMMTPSESSYASSMSPSMQPFKTVILLQVQGVLYLYYWVIPMTAKPTCY
jgi:hypothetical protein